MQNLIWDYLQIKPFQRFKRKLLLRISEHPYVRAEVKLAEYLGAKEQTFSFLWQVKLALRSQEHKMREKLRDDRRRLAIRLKTHKRNLQTRYKTKAEEILVIKIIEKTFELDTKYRQLLERSKLTTTKLCLQVCEEIIGVEVQKNSNPLGNQLRKTLYKLPSNLPLTIRVHPLDLSEISSRCKDVPAIQSLTADSAIERGAACIESTLGRIELNWREKLHCLISK